MKKTEKCLLIITLAITVFSGCANVGEKTASLSLLYGVCAVISLFILVSYCIFFKKKELWFILLFSSVLVVNSGYLALSVSGSVEEALLANRIAYLGSAFLPMFMLMIIMEVAKIKRSKWLVFALVILGVVMFILAASPGYSDIYYKDATIKTVNGVTVLCKTYGPLHSLYLYYLLGYFSVIIGVTIHSALKNKLEYIVQTIMLIFAVFVNIGVWFIEQLVDIDFEILAVSYIISELFLLGLNLIAKENERLKAAVINAESKLQDDSNPPITDVSAYDGYIQGLTRLTATEKHIYELYINGKNTLSVLESLSIKENTLKFHNKNIYSKLGVSSRKELIEIYKILKNSNVI